MIILMRRLVLSTARTYCPTMSISATYAFTMLMVIVLVLSDHSIVVSMQLPLTVLAGVRLLLTVRISRAMAVLRAILAVTDFGQDGLTA